MAHETDIDLSAVPLFPLPGVVLFPHAILPLHIFEQRYREMTADAIAGDKLVAMALLKDGWEKDYYSRPAIEPVVCVGRIVSHEQLSDGKYNFLLEGIRRARIVEESKHHSYRTARLLAMEELPASDAELQPTRERLDRLFARPPFSLTGPGRQFRKLVKTPLRTNDLIDLASFTFLDCPKLKQSLLAEVDVGLRAKRAASALEEQARTMPTPPMQITGPDDPAVN